MHPLIAELARDQRTVRHILDTHLEDDHGRCTGCALDSSLRPAWPCGVRTLAEQAQQGEHSLRLVR